MNFRVETSVPASSANLGPGFDILGLALPLRLSVKATSAPAWKVVTQGTDASQLAGGEDNLIVQAFRRGCERRGWRAEPLRILADNSLPIARGLGSSAAAVVSGLALAQLIHQGSLDKDALFQEAAAMEGHGDNAAAAVYGGLQQVSARGEERNARGRALDESVRVLLVVPSQQTATRQMRTVIPDKISPPLQTANDTALQKVLAGLAQGDAASLRYSQTDQRHQPFRLAVQPESAIIFELLLEIEEIAGVFLSGAGTTVGGWVVGQADPSGRVRSALKGRAIEAQVRLVRPDPIGVTGTIDRG